MRLEMTPFISRALALLLGLAMILLVWAGMVQPFLGENRLVQTWRLQADQRRIAERQGQLAAERARLNEAGPATDDFLTGANAALAAADLQGKLKPARGNIVSVEPIPFPDEEGFHRAGLRLKLTLPQDALPGLLHDIEDSEPRLFISSLSIKAVNGDLTLSIDLFGYLANEPGKSSGEAAPILPPLANYGELLHRPLFTPTRRPSGAVAAAQLASNSLRLAGLVAEAGHTVALIHLDERKTEVRVGLGASLNGWQVAAIDAKGLDLAAGRQHVHIGLKQAIPPSPE